MNILMVAAENDSLSGGKVGGIGDVVRDIPPALANAGHQVNVITPGYGSFSKLPGAVFKAQLSVDFAGKNETVVLYQVPGKVTYKGVTFWVLEHPLFMEGGIGRIYCDDPSDRPFATDATKFALFCKAVCEYSAPAEKSLTLKKILPLCETELLKWIAKTESVDSAHFIALHRVSQWMTSVTPEQKPILITSVDRIPDQKILILKQIMPDGKTALEKLLDQLGDKGFFILLGTGDSELENLLASIAAQKQNFLFLKGYSEELANKMYASGDLFLMPSSFEPCGISQMLAMKQRQPCLVHDVGGLSDTVEDDINGFVFSGDSLTDQAKNMIQRLQSILSVYQNDKKQWSQIKSKASAARFSWAEVAEKYTSCLYVNES